MIRRLKKIIMENLMLNAATEREVNAPVPLFSEANQLETRRAEAWLDDRLTKARKLHKDDLHSETCLITPAMAEVILKECNRGNRRLRGKKIAAYMKAIVEGRWKVHGQGISFAKDGKLNNGQHRLNAIILAGRSVRMHVVFGEDWDVFDVLDTGSNRSGSDTLHSLGYKNTTTLASAARLWSIVTGKNPNGNPVVDNDEIRAIIAANPRLEDLTTPAHRIGKKLGTSGSALAVAFYLIDQKSSNSRRLDHFIEKLSSGAELRAKDAILVLRDSLRAKSLEARRDGTGKNARTCAAAILAWNKWINGSKTSPGSLRWTSGEPYPQPE